jgi:hypothetical protein
VNRVLHPSLLYAAELRNRGMGKVSDFDRFDGGINAQALFLFENPGPMAAGSGFISRNTTTRLQKTPSTSCMRLRLIGS